MNNNVIIAVAGELWCAFICLVSLCVVNFHHDDSRNDECMRLMLSVCVILLICDSIAWGLDGDPGNWHRILLEISNFLVYACNYFLTSLFCVYLWNMVKKPGESVPIPFHLFGAVTVIALVLHIVGKPFGLYYTLDAQNIYHRGPYFWIANIPGPVGAVILAWGSMHFRKRLSGYSKIAAVSYCVLPTVATVIQVSFYGYPVQVFALAVATFITFFVREQEVRSKLIQILEEEKKFKTDLEEMNLLLEKRMAIIQSVIKTYYASYYIDLTTNSYIELSTNSTGRSRYAPQGRPQEALYDMCHYLILPEFEAPMRQFVDLTTLNDRMQNKNTIILPFIGITAGWSEAYFIAGDRDETGCLKSVIWAARTIHEEKQLEEDNNKKLREAMQRAEAANKAKTVFLNNMSHDLRTPLNAILGFSKMMEKEMDDPIKVREHIKRIKESGEYLLSIINNVLDMSRIESGKIELDRDEMLLSECADSLFKMFGDAAAAKNLTVTNVMNIQHDCICADKARLTQVLTNLVSNAIKYTPNGGEIHISMDEIDCEKDGYATYITKISDNGIGMSEEFQKQIFEEFTRERTTTESKVIGTGLGMSIVKKLIELMGGTIGVDSEVGKGSTFTVTLTHKVLEHGKVSVQNDCELDTEVFLGKRILLAEDNDLNAEIAEALLQEFGFEIERAEDGVICIEKLSKAEPEYFDLILMDIQMPNMNGYEATEAIRQMRDPKKAMIPIVAMTANAFEEDKKEALRRGMNGHISKPIDTTALLQILTRFFV